MPARPRQKPIYGRRDVAPPAALVAALRAAEPDAVARYLDADPDLAFQNRRGATPLHRAVQWGKRHVVRLLLAAGADPVITDRAGQRPLAYARNPDIRRLLEDAELRSAGQQG